MPVKKRRTVKRRAKPQVMLVGGNAFTDFFTKTIPNAGRAVYSKVIKPVAGFVKDQKLISKGLSMIPDPRAQLASKVASQAGLGRRRKRRAPQVGGLRSQLLVNGANGPNVVKFH